MARIGAPALAVAGFALFGGGIAAGMLLSGGGSATSSASPASASTPPAEGAPAPAGGTAAPRASAAPAPAAAGELTSASVAAGDRDSLRALLDRIPRPDVPAGSGVVTGKVARADGTPVADVRVRLRSNPPPRGDERSRSRYYFEEADPVETVTRALENMRWYADSSRDGVSGADGAYRVEGLSDADYWLVPPEKGWTLQARGLRTGKFRAGQVVDIVAVPTVEVDLTVLLPDGAEPREAMFLTQMPGGGQQGFSWSPTSRVATVPAGRTEFHVTSGEEFRSDPAPLDLKEGAPPLPLVVSLRGRPGVRGRIEFAPGEDWPWVQVWIARRISGDLPDGAAVKNQSMQSTNAGQHDGYRFAFQDLPAGRYVVAASPHNVSATGVAEVEVAGAMAEVVVRVPAMPREDYVIATVRGAGGQAVTDAQFMMGVTYKNGSSSSGVQPVARPDGTQLLPIPDNLREREKREGAEWWLEATSRTHGSKRVALSAGPAPEVFLQFSEAATVTLRLQGYAGSAVEGRIALHLQTAEAVASGNLSWSGRNNDAAPDAEGRRTLGAVQPGEYEAVITPSQNPWEFLATTSVTVRPGAQEIVVPMPALHSLVVTGATGRIHASQRVDRSAGGGRRRSVSRSAEPGADGRAVLDLLPEGEYSVNVSGKPSQTVKVPGTTEVQF